MEAAPTELVLYTENFQRVKKAKLHFPVGVTVITGPSNSSKSGLLRSLRVAVLNQPRPDTITYGESHQVVGIKYAGHEVIYRRDKSGSSPVKYKVDGTVYQKVGKGQLQEVADALHLNEVDFDDDHVPLFFQGQMKYPFLLDKTGSQLFKFIAGASGEDKILQVVTTIKKDVTKKTQDVAKLEGKRDQLKATAASLKKQYGQLQPLLKSADECINLESRIQQFDALEQLVSRYQQVVTELDRWERYVEKTRNMVQVCDQHLPAIKDLESKVESVGVLVGRIEKGTALVDELVGDSALKKSTIEKNELAILSAKETSDKIDALEPKVDAVKFLFDKILKQINDLSVLKEEQTQLALKWNTAEGFKDHAQNILTEFENLTAKKTNVFHAIERCEQIEIDSNVLKGQISLYNEELAQVEAEKAKIPYCPFCGSVLNGENHEH